MSSVCFYFQMHQPVRLRRYSVFDTDPEYFDDAHNVEILHRVAEKCYLPATQLLLELAERHDSDFRCSISVTGILLDALQEHAPAVIETLTKLAASGHVEFLNETYHHSLSFCYSRDEFRAQVDQHAQRIESLFGQRPRIFRNTELIYNNDLAHFVESLGRHHGILTEGADRVLGDRSPDVVYRPPHCEGLAVLLRNYGLSDDIGFRFSDQNWSGWPLTPEKFVAQLDAIAAHGSVCNLFIDFETFGEHQWEETGILRFLDQLPQAVLDGGHDFKTLSEAIEAYPPQDTFDTPNMISWADTERDLSAWLGNAMQSNALHELYKLERPAKSSGDAQLLDDWRHLTVSDHFYYMCTKYSADGDIHNYFNPYESPYDAYINFMNVLDNLRTRLD